MDNLVRPLVAQLPGLGALMRYVRRHYPGRHAYSPLPDYGEVKSRADLLFSKDVDLGPSIQLRSEAQVALLNELACFYPQFDWPEHRQPEYRYYLANDWFRHGDAIILYAMLRYLRPKKVIEVGSGFSSALMLDTNEKFLDHSSRFTFIEPSPGRLFELLDQMDRQSVHLLRNVLQETPISTFSELDTNDILFIDSSHISKIGSDVNYALFQVLPSLRPGVVVHFHDVFWPFEYPQEWILEGRTLNEAYFLRAFLQYNQAFQVLLFNSYIGYKFGPLVKKIMPEFLKDTGGSIWLRKE
jgi:predicted O-methyltransferase YrrM